MHQSNLHKEYIYFFRNKITIFIILILFFSSFGSAMVFEKNSFKELEPNFDIVWDVKLNFNEPGSSFTYVVFGEASDASDEKDDYDMPIPPAPLPPYIRAWFKTNLSFPYDKLIKDYRYYPDTFKQWNFSLLWIPSDYVTPTNITISWENSELYDSEYTVVKLYDDNGDELKDMLTESSYTFNCPASVLQNFSIICQTNSAPNQPYNPIPANGSFDVNINANLHWTCSDPDGDPLKFDVYFGTTNPPPKVVSNQTSMSYNPGTMNYETVYYWKIVAWDNHNASRSGDIWHFTTIGDKVPPIVNITQPQLGFIYFYFIVQWRLRIYPTDSTLVIGKIDIKANVIDNVGVSWVKFYINDTLKATLYEPPYIYSWNELTYYDLYRIKIVASDYSGNIKSEEVAVWKFQLFEVSE